MEVRFGLSVFLMSVVITIPLVVHGHGGRRLEVIVLDDQLLAHGYNSKLADQDGGLRTYHNAIHDQWDNFGGGLTAATARLPGFDVFDQANSVVDSTTANILQGADLTLSLIGAVKWENVPISEPFGLPIFDDVLPSETITIGNATSFVDTNSFGMLALATTISPLGEEDLDLDYSISREPVDVIYVLQWVLSTDKPGISASANVFTMLSPDSSDTNGLRAQAIHLEKYLSVPLIPGDYDRNGKVDVLDSKVWKEQFGHQPRFSGAGADGNKDRFVNAGDFSIWRNRVGMSAPLLDKSFTIPEPNAISLLMIGWGVLLLKRLGTNSSKIWIT